MLPWIYNFVKLLFRLYRILQSISDNVLMLKHPMSDLSNIEFLHCYIESTAPMHSPASGLQQKKMFDQANTAIIREKLPGQWRNRFWLMIENKGAHVSLSYYKGI